MGCANSKSDDEGPVLRCWRRMQLVKQVLKHRNSFAAAQLSYLDTLGRVAVAFGQLAESELEDQAHFPLETLARHVSAPMPSPMPSTFPALPPPPSRRASSAEILPLALFHSLPSVIVENTALSDKTPLSVSKLALSPPRKALSPPKAALLPPSLSLSPPRAITFPDKALPPPPKAMLSPPKMYLPPPPLNGYVDKLDDATFGQQKRNLKLEEQKAKAQQLEIRISDKKPALELANTDQPSPQSVDLDSPPSPEDENYGWDWFDLFQPPPMPIHLQEQRRYKSLRGEDELDLPAEDELDELPFLEDEESQPNTEKDKSLEMSDVKKEEDEKMEDQEVQLQVLQEEPKGKKMQEINTKIEDEMESKTADLDSNLSVKHSEELEEDEPENEDGHEETRAVAAHEPINLLEALREIQEEFSKAVETGKDFSQMLKTSKNHFSPELFNSKGLSEHAAQLLRGLTWSQGPYGNSASWSRLENTEDSTSKECGMMGGYPSTFDRLYAWEKKLYDEVKVLEKINIEFEKKRRLLRTFDAKGENYYKVEKARAAIKALENQMMVSIQALEVISSSIKKVVEEEMYPQMLELLKGLKKIWKTLFDCHRNQKDSSSMTWIPEGFLGNSIGNFKRDDFLQLETALKIWDEFLGNVFCQQKEYIESVDEWLKLSLLKPDRETKNRGSATRRGNPPIFQLCEAWRGELNKFDPRHAVEAIKTFATIVHNIDRQQIEEPKDQKNETLSKNLQTTGFPNYTEDNHHETLKSKKTFAEGVNALGKHLERHEEKVALMVTRDSHVSSLKLFQEGLPALFQALSDFAGICFQTYEEIVSKIKNERQEL